jgi:hypothetical protein
MATKFIRARTNIVRSDFADYSRPSLLLELIDTHESDEILEFELDVETTGRTISLSAFSSISKVVIHNEDALNFVEAQWFNPRGTKGTGDLAFANVNPDTITDNAAGGVFIISGGQVGGYVRVSNSTNSGVFLIQNIAPDVITLGILESIVNIGNDVTATLSFESKNLTRVDGTRTTTIGNVAPAGNLTLTADTSTVHCRVFIWGT